MFVVDRDGRVRHLDKGGLSIPGNVTRRRASHIVPVDIWARAAFNLIRALVSDESRVAEWTRSWPCVWQVDLRLSSGPVVSGFHSREAAVTFEESWLLANGMGDGQED